MKNGDPQKPDILAPAGDRVSFMAAIAAGADAVYCGLKQFSARMAAKNFTVEELAPLAELARDKGVKIHVAFNTLIKADELDSAGRLIEQLNQWVKPDALIIQDLALVTLAKQAGYSGKLHLSTLSNVSFAAALKTARKHLDVNRIVLPRELSIDEIKAMAVACPDDLDLEVFVHGALCYAVSGRCYWSSYLGGKSGLRGRCVQPCRRIYHQETQRNRFFSCRDLSLDVLVKVLLTIPQVRAWKIEGRKKGPHYIFHTVEAYRMLRDRGSDPDMKREALQRLARALGRPGTHYNFLPQRPQRPVDLAEQTGSGLFLGKVKGTGQKPFFTPGEALLPGDILRLGYEDEPWHRTERIGRSVPKRGRYHFKAFRGKGPIKGVSVFLLDRRETALEEMLAGLEKELSGKTVPGIRPSTFKAGLPKGLRRKAGVVELTMYRTPERMTSGGQTGVWLSAGHEEALPGRPRPGFWWWLPPVVWPDQEEAFKARLDRLLKKGARNFVLNAPWQTALFHSPKKLNLWAGPFCNTANPLAIESLASLGIRGVIVSPELGRDTIVSLPKQSPLPMGVVIYGHWPLCVSRTLSESVKPAKPFTSPMGEQAWVSKHGPDFWLFPNWNLDLRDKQQELEQAGYSLFVHLLEPVPKEVKLKEREGVWNWDVNLL
ncbi:MAG: U32 family peptidase [Pseudomonadota bacterium]